MITISKELLEQSGYKCWKEYPEQEPHICRKWQKLFSDERGKKYFININESFGWNPHIESGDEFHNFWPSVQFNIFVPSFGYHSIEVNLVQWFNESGKYTNIDIEMMEMVVDSIWRDLEGQYYEI